MLVVDVIRVNYYPFLAFSDLTCHVEGTGIVFFLVALCYDVVTFLVVWISLRSLGFIGYGR